MKKVSSQTVSSLIGHSNVFYGFRQHLMIKWICLTRNFVFFFINYHYLSESMSKSASHFIFSYNYPSAIKCFNWGSQLFVFWIKNMGLFKTNELHTSKGLCILKIIFIPYFWINKFSIFPFFFRNIQVWIKFGRRLFTEGHSILLCTQW